MRTRYAVLFALICASSCVLAAPCGTARSVSAAVDRMGARAFLASLDEDAADRLFERIASGRADWVALAPKLARGADGANAEGLGIALADALPKNPSAVLGVADPLEGDGHVLAISRICGMPFIEDTLPPAYRAAALRAVASASGVSLEIKTRCAAALRGR